LAQNLKSLKQIQDKDPKFLKRVFVSHYCNIPFHLLDKRMAAIVERDGFYPSALIDDLYSASFHLMRNFELAPFATDTKLEDLITRLVEDGKI
jgi:hypothetical protein